jgi:hypothetical protein
MHLTIFLHQVGWFDGKGVHIHLWGYGSNLTNNIVVVNNAMLIIYTLHS